MIDRLVSWLEQSNLGLSDEDIADAIWLAMQMGESSSVESQEEEEEGEEPQIQTMTIEEISEAPALPAEQPFSIFPADAMSRSSEESKAAPEGLPFQAPAAASLQNALELGRALRPLMRKVPSPTQVVLDEEATVNRIIEEEIWQPVLTPAPERWLDLELVVEASPLSQIWQETIADFQHKVLERQGAFRNVQAWTLKSTGDRPHLFTRNPGDSLSRAATPQELVHPSGRRLVMVLSDCRSSLWQQHPSTANTDSAQPGNPNLYRWLSYWANHGPVLLVQLLPEWLWERSALDLGYEAMVCSLFPGAANTQLNVQGLSQRDRNRADVPNALKLIVTTLDAEVLLQCAEVIAGGGTAQAPGVVFNLSRLRSLIEATQAPTGIEQPTPDTEAERIVDTFLATASPTAQQLAGMMAAVPVSLPVVHLLQAKLLQNSTPVHMAEVYMSGLLERQGTSERTQAPIYDFKPEVRKLLNRAMPRYTTTMVLETLSQAIAEKLNVSISSFAAFLSPKREWLEADRTIARFAEILPKVLRNLGEEWAALVEQAEAIETLRDRFDLPAVEPVMFPPLKILEFETVQLVEPGADSVSPQLETQEVEVVTILVEEEISSVSESLQLFEFEVATLERIIDQQQQPDFLQNLLGRVSQRDRWIIHRQRRQAYQWIEPLSDTLRLEMVSIPAGTFLMGSPKDELHRSSDESPQHTTTINGFLMSKYPITQAQWRFVAGLPKVNRRRKLKNIPSRFSGDNLPVERVSWYDAVEFCNRLSAHTGREYRLPTEAEWEYACRGGTTTPFHFGETIIADLANYDAREIYGDGVKGEYRKTTTPVEHFNVANIFGLCDMHGNVWEWCLDQWHRNYDGAPADGSAWVMGGDSNRRVVRGGSWNFNPRVCRSACRSCNIAENVYYDIGFRVVCVIPRILQ